MVQCSTMLVQMAVRGLMFDPYNNAFIVILKDSEESNDVLPIWIGKSEATSISLALEGITAPRPMTHDLIKTLLEAVDATLISVVVSELKENTYFAKLHLTYHDAEVAVDARPSDAIALSLRLNAPIFVTDDVLKKHSSEELDRWLDNLRPEDFGKYDT